MWLTKVFFIVIIVVITDHHYHHAHHRQEGLHLHDQSKATETILHIISIYTSIRPRTAANQNRFTRPFYFLCISVIQTSMHLGVSANQNRCAKPDLVHWFSGEGPYPVGVSQTQIHWNLGRLGHEAVIRLDQNVPYENADGTLIAAHCEYHPLIVFSFLRPLLQFKINVVWEPRYG